MLSLDNVTIRGVTPGKIENMKTTGLEIFADEVFVLPNAVQATLTGVPLTGGAVGISVLGSTAARRSPSSIR